MFGRRLFTRAASARFGLAGLAGTAAVAWNLVEGRGQAACDNVKLGVLQGKESTLHSVAPIVGKACKPEDVDMVIYHGRCPDGFAAAFAAYLALGDKCTYIGIGHNAKRLPKNVDGKNVAILDFSFDAKTMAELVSRANSVIVLDHHASAKTNLVDLPEENKVFEMNQSGVTLAWDFFAPVVAKRQASASQSSLDSFRAGLEAGSSGALDCPLLFRYIEDRDIWRWTMQNSKEFSAACDMALPVPRFGAVNLGPNGGPGDFAPLMEAYEGGNAAIAAIVARGEAVLEYQDSVIGRHIRGAKVRRLKNAPEHKALVVNASTLPSEIGNVLSIKGLKHGIGYVIVARYNFRDDPKDEFWSFSLRSAFGSPEAEQFSCATDVSLVAGAYGGGGHRAAAGMAVKGVRDIEELFVPEETWERSPRL